MKIIARYSVLMREVRAFSFMVPAMGLRFLRERPLWTLGLSGLAMLLSAFGTWLHSRMGVVGDSSKEALLTATALLPLEMFFVPQFLAAVDAQTLNRPENPQDGWRERFEARWLRAFGTKMLLAVAISAGIILLVLPGLMIFLLFGWAPILVLLRGQRLAQAAQNSAQWMIRLWPIALASGSAILLVYVGLVLTLSVCLTAMIPEAVPLARLHHPGAWAADFIMGLLNLWFSAAFLALFHVIERDQVLK